MARASLKLIEALRKTADNLANGSPYQWGHMGACNCGNLAQELTKYSKAEIHAFAMRKHGDWNEQVSEYCDTSGFHIDMIISEMLQSGLSIEDLMNLEKLSDDQILLRLPKDKRHLEKNNKQHVELYMRAWADLLEEQWAEANIKIPKEELDVVKN
ncbi:MAG: hypothetical protein LAT68_06455 [Cyclobacteriaceae bacterium]|nr:hypothetical protein [Cyclobacteriaceae bacterium]MCH8515952.1 hypothetical protein [Cyclobacteriaceae bacterium]